tara:strand:+ start:139856 stop:142606 length:2751 start_codon:yes stop_codon:yes gene_type:complete
MSILVNRFYPVGLADCRIKNGSLLLNIFQNNGECGMQTMFIEVSANREYQIMLSINDNSMKKKYLICRDELNNQIGSREIINSNGEYDFRYIFDGNLKVSFFILIDNPYPNQEIRIDNFRFIEREPMEREISDEEQEIQVLNNNCFMIVQNGTYKDPKGFEAYQMAKYLKFNKISYVLVYLDNEAVRDNLNVDPEKIGNVYVTKILKKDRFFQNRRIVQNHTSLYSQVKNIIIQNLGKVPDYIFTFDTISTIFSFSLFDSPKIISIGENSIINNFYATTLINVKNDDMNELFKYKQKDYNFPSIITPKYKEYWKKYDVLVFDDLEIPNKYSKIVAKYDDNDLEEKISQSKVIIINKNNELNRWIISLGNYYYCTCLINNRVDEKELVFEKYRIDDDKRKTIIKLNRNLNNDDDIILHMFKPFEDILKTLDKDVNKHSINILVLSCGSVLNDLNSMKMYKLINLLKSFNINVYGIFYGNSQTNNDPNNLGSIYNVDRYDEIILRSVINDFEHKIDLTISDNIEFSTIASDLIDNMKSVLYVTKPIITDITTNNLTLMKNMILIPETEDIMIELLDLNMLNMISDIDFSYLPSILSYDKEKIYDIAIVVDDSILNNYENFILEIVNKSHFDTMSILMIQDQDYKIQRKCTHPDLTIRTMNKYNNLLESLCTSNKILVLSNDEKYHSLVIDLFKNNREVIIQKDNRLSLFINRYLELMTINNLIELIDCDINYNFELMEYEMIITNSLYYCNYKNKSVQFDKNSSLLFLIDETYEEKSNNEEFTYDIEKTIPNELSSEYFELFYSMEESKFHIVILTNCEKNKMYDLSVSTKYYKNTYLWKINSPHLLEEFKGAKKYYFVGDPDKYHNNLLDETSQSYLYLHNSIKNVCDIPYTYVIYEKDDFIQFAFPNSQIINLNHF